MLFCSGKDKSKSKAQKDLTKRIKQLENELARAKKAKDDRLVSGCLEGLDRLKSELDSLKG